MTQIIPGTIYHIYNRSVLKIPIFRCPPDYTRFLVKMDEYRLRYPVELMAFCLMPNHFRFLIKEPYQTQTTTTLSIPRFLQLLQSSYAKYFGIKYEHTGRVFQGVYKRKIIKNDLHLNIIIEYINNNPVRKKLVDNAKDWPYSTVSHNNSNLPATDLKG